MGVMVGLGPPELMSDADERCEGRTVLAVVAVSDCPDLRKMGFGRTLPSSELFRELLEVAVLSPPPLPPLWQQLG
jgi:hypothetical protein